MPLSLRVLICVSVSQASVIVFLEWFLIMMPLLTDTSLLILNSICVCKFLIYKLSALGHQHQPYSGITTSLQSPTALILSPHQPFYRYLPSPASKWMSAIIPSMTLTRSLCWMIRTYTHATRGTSIIGFNNYPQPQLSKIISPSPRAPPKPHTQHTDPNKSMYMLRTRTHIFTQYQNRNLWTRLLQTRFLMFR